METKVLKEALNITAQQLAQVLLDKNLLEAQMIVMQKANENKEVEEA